MSPAEPTKDLPAPHGTTEGVAMFSGSWWFSDAPIGLSDEDAPEISA
jgi:hypothetical protein